MHQSVGVGRQASVHLPYSPERNPEKFCGLELDGKHFIKDVSYHDWASDPSTAEEVLKYSKLVHQFSGGRGGALSAEKRGGQCPTLDDSCSKFS